MTQLDDFNHFLRDLEDLNNFKNIINGKSILQCVPELYIRKRRQHRRRRFNPLRDLHDKIFAVKYRFSKVNIRRIVEIVRDDLESDYKRKNQVPVELQIMAAIRSWGLSEQPCETASAHSVSLRTLEKIKKRVAIVLSSKASRYIRMPTTLAEKEKVINAFQSLSCMQHVIGVIAHSNVNLINTNKMKAAPDYSHMHIQIVSDASLKIRDLDCRLCSSIINNTCTVSDIFNQTRIKERFEQNEFRGRVLLGDDTFPCTPYLLTPHCPTIDDLTYTESHKATLAAVVNCQNLWKHRFQILNSEICITSGNSLRHTIVALALLHNMAIDWNDYSCADDGLK